MSPPEIAYKIQPYRPGAGLRDHALVAPAVFPNITELTMGRQLAAVHTARTRVDKDWTNPESESGNGASPKVNG